MAYPYFAATLPVQRFGEAPEWTMETFRAECAEQLSAHDNATLLALLDGGESADPYVCAWRDVETQLRNAVARLRAARLPAGANAAPADAAKWLRPHGGWSVALENAVAAAFQEDTPLKREQALARIRWEWAGELAGTDPFSANAIFCYGLRLAIAGQLAHTDPVKGEARMRAFTEAAAPAIDAPGGR